jgi:hypothetical protein
MFQEDNVDRLSILVESLKVLESDADRQKNFLIHFHGIDNDSNGKALLTNTDELGLMFDDAYVLSPRLLEEGLIDQETASCLNAISLIMLKNSGLDNEQFWTVEALYEEQGWSDIRNRAKTALSLITKRGGKPRHLR